MTDDFSKDEILFDVLTPLGFRVRVTRSYWELIVTVKHPVIVGREFDVQETLQTPDEIRQSNYPFLMSDPLLQPARSAEGFAAVAAEMQKLQTQLQLMLVTG